MSMNFSALLEAVDGSSGYYGGVIRDEMPAMSLEECFAAASLGIMNTRLDSIQQTANSNAALVEATISSAGTGNTYMLHSVVEGAFDTLKAKAKAIFEKIKKFLQSIIAKLKLTIDKIRLSGHQLYTKYKDSAMLKKNFKDMEVEGYNFTATDMFTPGSKFDGGVQPLIEAVFGAEGKALDAEHPPTDEAQVKTYEDAIDKVKDLSTSEVQFRMVEQLVSCSGMSESSWQSDLKKELGMDEKKTLKHGTDFSLDTVAMLLKEPANLDKIKTEYEKLERAVDKDKTAFERKVDTAYKAIDKDRRKRTPGKTEAERTENAAMDKQMSLMTNAKDALLRLYNDGYAVINQVKTIKYNFEKAKVDQAKMIFSRMLSYKEPKGDNNSAGDFGNYVDFDVDV